MMKLKDRIINIVNNSTMEKQHGRVIGFYIREEINKHNRYHCIQFRNESFILKFSDNCDKLIILNRDTFIERELSEIEFLTYLDILIEIDSHRQKGVELRKAILDIDKFKIHLRDKKIESIL